MCGRESACEGIIEREREEKGWSEKARERQSVRARAHACMQEKAREKEHKMCCVLDICFNKPKTLQHTATHCNTLQHTATHCTLLRPRYLFLFGTSCACQFPFPCVQCYILSSLCRVAFLWMYLCLFYFALPFYRCSFVFCISCCLSVIVSLSFSISRCFSMDIALYFASRITVV